MSLEAAMVCVDNSEWMRNGDLRPSRMRAVQEAVNMVCRAKVEANAESVVGLLSMAGKRIQTHVTLTRSVGAIMNALEKEVVVEGTSNFKGAVATAQLALKNRQNKNQRQRIIMFIGSPVEDEEKSLVKLGKKLKKNNIAVDIVNFGTENDENDNKSKLLKFVDTVNSGENSHFLHVPPGPQHLSDVVVSSVILSSGSGGGGGMGVGAGMGAAAAGVGGGGAGGFGGVDPNVDPELAMALRLSMEEARQRQQGASGTPGETATAAPASGDGGNAAMEEEEEDEDDAALLAQAIALSMAQGDDGAAAEDGGAAAMQEEEEEEDVADALQDPDFIASLLDSAGVDQDELGDILGGDDQDQDQDTDKDKDKDKDAAK